MRKLIAQFDRDYPISSPLHQAFLENYSGVYHHVQRIALETGADIRVSKVTMFNEQTDCEISLIYLYYGHQEDLAIYNMIADEFTCEHFRRLNGVWIPDWTKLQL